MARLAEVLKVHPYFLSKQAAADFLGIAKKTLSNELSSGVFPVKPIYRNSKPLFPYSALQEYAKSLEKGSNTPTKKRGRKRNCGAVNGRSTAAGDHPVYDMEGLQNSESRARRK